MRDDAAIVNAVERVRATLRGVQSVEEFPERIARLLEFRNAIPTRSGIGDTDFLQREGPAAGCRDIGDLRKVAGLPRLQARITGEQQRIAKERNFPVPYGEEPLSRTAAAVTGKGVRGIAKRKTLLIAAARERIDGIGDKGRPVLSRREIINTALWRVGRRDARLHRCGCHHHAEAGG